MSETPLLQELRGIILAEGPISVGRYMQLCLGHPRWGYYMTRDPFGEAGDFVTAPEISQMFGELLGLWCVDTWSRLGSPSIFHLVELGPGRGTLMADALRAARLMPDFARAVTLHLVETSPLMREKQAAALASSGVSPLWHAGLESLPADAPLILLANEFFDALPVRQFVRAADGWRERLVGLDADGALAFGLAPETAPDLSLAAPVGSLVEVAEAARGVAEAIARRLAAQGGALLALDYGHARSGLGETLQAVKRHAFVDVLAEPGEADLTVHVDFAMLARRAQSAGALAFPVVEQGAFLEALGVVARADALKRRADAVQAAAIDAALARLTGRQPPGMGALFKAFAMAGTGLSELAGFGEASPPSTPPNLGVRFPAGGAPL